DEPVEQDPGTRAQQRLERLLDELCAGRRVQQGLGACADDEGWVLDQLSDPLRRLHSAGLTQKPHVDVSLAQLRFEIRGERRLARSVESFDGDQSSTGHHCKLRRYRWLASVRVLELLDRHPHARAVLAPALSQDGHPSHAYLFHGPGGAGKRSVARAVASELL